MTWKDEDVVSVVKAAPAWTDDEIAPSVPEKPSLGKRFMRGVSDIVAAPEVLASLGTGALGQAV